MFWLSRNTLSGSQARFRVASRSWSGSYGAGCTFSFSVPDVPGGSKLYQVEISHRGKMNLSREDAESGSAADTLGG